MESKRKMKIDKIDNDWISCSFTKKEKILAVIYIVVYIFVSLSILLFTARLLRSMPDNMFKLVLMSAVLLACMLVGLILSIPFKWLEAKNGN